MLTDVLPIALKERTITDTMDILMSQGPQLPAGQRVDPKSRQDSGRPASRSS